MFMKLLTISLAMLSALPVTSLTAEPEKEFADKTHKVVFEVAIDGADKWLGALRNVETVQESLDGQKGSGQKGVLPWKVIFAGQKGSGQNS